MANVHQPNDATSKPSASGIGLALGGGGARGLAHILILEAFDELGIKPAIIAGTSIGAIFGAAYAAGLTAAEIRKRSEEILSNPAEIARRLFSSATASWKDLLTFRPSFPGALINPQSLIEIVFPEATAKKFTELKIPLRVIATDYGKQVSVILQGGTLAPAIAASMALPALFRPVERDGLILVDGGLTNPLPYDIMQTECAITVAVDVTGLRTANNDRKPNALEAILGTSQIMQNAIIREKLKRHTPDILIRPPVDDFRILEFYRIRKILTAAEPIKDELKRALQARLSGGREKTI